MIQLLLSAIRKKRQYVAALIANLAIACMGASMAWTSPMESKLKDMDESPLPEAPTASELSWIGSILTLGSLLGPAFAGFVAHRFGRKLALLISAVFFLAAYVLFLTTQSVAQILVGRFLQGCGIGFAITITPLYVGEIATVERRGALGSLVQTFITLGLLLDYAIGPYVSYGAFQWIQMALPLLFVAGFVQMPETPHFYVSKGDYGAAARSLAYIRGEPISELQAEFNSIQFSVEESLRNRGTIKDLFIDHANFRALIICTGVVVFQQFSGINPVQFFAQTIFDRTGTDIPADLSAIVLGIFQVISSIVTAVIVDRVGRRPTLLTSALGMCCSLTALGTYFYLDNQSSEVASTLTFLPVASLVLFVIMFCTGFGPIAWVLLGEMFAPSIKSLASSVVSSICWLTSFFILFYFTSLDDALGSHWLFWIFAVCCAMAFVFTYVFVVETKGLSLPEIQARLNESAPVMASASDKC
ncbi:facilitated trehalose transporter Tret1-like [Culex quinquefasciatus]|uniref:facilitated trehalose transporter Tret1-like n=1 Tax=Culex quinquefasciatus TaxID=7176 RepID=UPI0018E349B7|nr:facilitated trehalose transporter Tret1-like [Culex quinquefasciatus]XP_039444705.1 facilitated trehalose transporter Tret1-like [Culex pipiens pallens]